MTRVIPIDDDIVAGVGGVSRCENVALNTIKLPYEQGVGRKRMLDHVHTDADDHAGEGHELKRIHVKRNVKWASTLEEFWDGLEKKRPVCGVRRVVKPILKKRGLSPSPMSPCSMSPLSEASDTSCQMIEKEAVKRPRRLKFTLRCGRKDSSATSTCVTLSSPSM